MVVVSLFTENLVINNKYAYNSCLLIIIKKGRVMKKSLLIAAVTSALCLASANVLAAGGHGGHGSSVDKSGKSACKTTQIKHMRPEHLATVAPGSEFSFRVQGIEDA
ncbi:MAG: hypothetical protein DRQ62_11875, partial [Gammaproteobacteria bacterium]